MAIDGIKIIDSDFAHDIYRLFMDSYDAGNSPAEATAAIAELGHDNDDVDEEIFITTLAHALWEVGGLTPEIVQKVEQVIARKSFVNYLKGNEKSTVASKQRAQALARFWNKISQTNPRPRKRKSYKTQKQFLFQEGDVLIHQLHDGSYCVVILMLISQHRGAYSYKFIVHTYDGLSKPTIPDIINGMLLGRIYEPPNFPDRRIGFHTVGVEHKSLGVFASTLEVIGNLTMQESAKCCGDQYGATDLMSFAESISSIAYTFLGDRRNISNSPRQIFPIAALVTV